MALPGRPFRTYQTTYLRPHHVSGISIPVGQSQPGAPRGIGASGHRASGTLLTNYTKSAFSLCLTICATPEVDVPICQAVSANDAPYSLVRCMMIFLLNAGIGGGLALPPTIRGIPCRQNNPGIAPVVPRAILFLVGHCFYMISKNQLLNSS